MKKLFTFFLITMLGISAFAQNNVGINTIAPDASAALDITSSSQGVLVPRMEKTLREAIANPATGLLVWQIDGVAGFYFNSGTPASPNWIQLGAKGDKGETGIAGPAGLTGEKGDKGSSGPGIPTGGTAGQILSKLDGSDFNTNWITPAAGGTSLPSQTGNSGKFLKTDGTGTSWATVSTAYPNVELQVMNNVSQNITSLFGTQTNNEYVFSGVNNPNASLTGGNTWNGSVFTVGNSGTGWYDVYIQIKGISSTAAVSTVGASILLDKNNAMGSNSITGSKWTSTYNSSTNESVNKNISTLRALMYLNAGETIRFKGQSWSTSISAYTSTDDSTNITIVRIK